MAEVRCPMCGRMNPEGQEVCKFCQARIIPLFKPPTGDNEMSFGKSDEDDVPDWLKDLRGDDDQGSGERGLEDEDVPDWLRSEGEDSSVTETEPDEGIDEAGEVPDWLARLGGAEETAEEAAPDSSPPFADQDEELPDWLRSEDSPEETLPDWTADSQAETSAESQAEGDSDWLNRVRSRFQDDQEAESPDFQEEQFEEDQTGALEGEADRGAPEFASLSTPGAGERASDEDEMPDWLSSLGREADETPQPAEAEHDLAPKAGITDWLNALDSEEGAGEAQEAQVEAAAEASDEGVPDWLSDLKEEQETAKEEAAEPGEEPAEQGEVPDWLKEVQGREAVEPAASAESPEESTDWMAALTSASDELQPVEEGELPPQGAEEPALSEEKLDVLGEQIPDWLDELDSGEEAALPEEAGAEPGEVFSDHAGEEIPDWLSGLSASAEEGQAPADSVPAMVVGDEEKTPEGVDSGYLTTLPEWVAQISEENEQPEEQGEEGSLERASLPEWLEAMRPVETAAPLVQYADEGDEHVENAGPLAGLRGVLPAEPEIARARKAPAYSIKLQVTDEQQARMLAIKRLIESESTPKSVPSPFMLPTSYIIRIMIFLVLVGSIVLVWWVGGDQLQTPLPSGTERKDVLTATQLIDQLSPNASVLIAVDYEPGFSGELDTAARAAISQLAGKGAYLALVSTSLSGPALGERLMASVPLPEGTSLKYINLGFIPGSSAGLQWFAQFPAQVVPKGLDGTSAWLDNPLSTLDGLGSFSLVIVITADSNVARAWIEQVQPQLSKGQIPLMMITSAQSEPMIRPYASSASHQVSALVSGLAGGVAYENELGQYYPLSSYWGAFSAAMTVTVVLLIIGSVVSLISRTLGREKPEKGEEQL